MTLSIRSILLSLSALLTVATLPGCDTDVELEALGVEVEDVDAMSEEELDELAHTQDELDLATVPTPPLPPVPRPHGPRKLVDANSHANSHADADIAAPFFAHPDELLNGDKLGLPPDDDGGCDPDSDELDLATR